MTVTIDLDSPTLAALDAAASLRKLSREATLREAVLHLADYDAYFRNEVNKGLEDIRAGRIISDVEMDAEADALINELDKGHEA